MRSPMSDSSLTDPGLVKVLMQARIIRDANGNSVSQEVSAYLLDEDDKSIEVRDGGVEIKVNGGPRTSLAVENAEEHPYYRLGSEIPFGPGATLLMIIILSDKSEYECLVRAPGNSPTGLRLEPSTSEGGRASLLWDNPHPDNTVNAKTRTFRLGDTVAVERSFRVSNPGSGKLDLPEDFLVRARMVEVDLEFTESGQAHPRLAKGSEVSTSLVLRKEFLID